MSRAASQGAPLFHGGLVLVASSGKVVARRLALPVPWYAWGHTQKIEQIFEDGVRAMLPRLEPFKLASADGSDELAGVKLWLLLAGESAACIVTDAAWPARGARLLLGQMLENPSTVVNAPGFLASKPPEDAIVRVQQQLGDVKVALVGAITAALDRGEKLEVLQEKATDLSAAATRFHTEAKKVNRCCWGLF